MSHICRNAHAVLSRKHLVGARLKSLVENILWDLAPEKCFLMMRINTKFVVRKLYQVTSVQNTMPIS